MTIKKSLVVILCLANFYAYGGTIATKIENQLYQCARIHQNIQRLSCYDALVSQQNKLSGLKLKPLKNTIAPLQTKQPLKAHASLKTILKTPSLVAEKRLLSKRSRDNLTVFFGQVHHKKNKAKVINSVEFVIRSAKLSLRKHWRLTFNNGQIWQAVESNHRIKFKVNNIVVIKRGFLNSFHLKKKGTNRSITVKRIK